MQLIIDSLALLFLLRIFFAVASKNVGAIQNPRFRAIMNSDIKLTEFNQTNLKGLLDVIILPRPFLIIQIDEMF